MKRRQFIFESFLYSGSFFLPRYSPLWSQQSKSEKSKVIRVGRSATLQKVKAVNAEQFTELLDDGMRTLFNCDDPIEPWMRLFKKHETIGLKVNCLSGPGSTNVILVNAISERLQQAGVKKENIIVWDRLSSDLEDGGFKIKDDRNQIRTIGNDISGFEDELSIFGSAASRISRIVTRECDAVINLPLLKDHSIAGLTMSLKNMFGAIHNPNKYHLNAGDPYIADINAFPEIREKVRLHICDAIEAQYEGGPSFMPHWRWPMGSLLISQDPVALDYTGWKIIDQKRKEMEFASLKDSGREPKYIATAADKKHGLGTNNPMLIDYVEI
jgi:uncharacterized protein (DUF362 family)